MGRPVRQLQDGTGGGNWFASRSVVSGVRWSPALVLAALLAGASACSRDTAVQKPSPPSPQPGVILGVYGERQDRGDPVRGVSGVRIGVYDQALSAPTTRSRLRP